MDRQIDRYIDRDGYVFGHNECTARVFFVGPSLSGRTGLVTPASTINRHQVGEGDPMSLDLSRQY